MAVVREGAKVELVAQVARVNTINDDLVVIGIAAADEQRGLCAKLSGLNSRCTWHEPQSTCEIGAQRKIEIAKDVCGSACLRLWRGRARSGDHNGFAHPLGLKNQVAFN